MRTATSELSLGGCYIESMFTLEIGTRLGLILTINSENIHLSGVVVTKYPQVGNGIDFVEMDEADLAKLSAFIDEHVDDKAQREGA